MKRLLILATCLVLAASAREPKKPRVDGHGDGEVHLPLAILVVDATSGDPISDARVTFYDDLDLAILMSIDVAQKKVFTPPEKIPTGTTAHTSRDGRATIACRFDAAFLWSFDSGQKKDVGTDVFPSGRFVISKQGYRLLERTAQEIFSSSPYSPEQLKIPLTLRLEKEPTSRAAPTPPPAHPAGDRP